MKRITTFAVAAIALVAVGTAVHAKDAHDEHERTQRSMRFFMGGSSGQLGVQVDSMTKELRGYFGAPDSAGILVSRVDENSPAAAAGVQVGDVIVSVDGDDIDTPWDVWKALSGHGKGDKVAVIVIRGKKRVQLAATLADDAVEFDTQGMKFGFGNGSGDDAFGFDLDDLNRLPRAIFRGSRTEIRDLEKKIERLEKKIENLERRSK